MRDMRSEGYDNFIQYIYAKPNDIPVLIEHELVRHLISY